jgi:hypothetical protein
LELVVSEVGGRLNFGFKFALENVGFVAHVNKWLNEDGEQEAQRDDCNGEYAESTDRHYIAEAGGGEGSEGGDGCHEHGLGGFAESIRKAFARALSECRNTE